MGGWKAKSIFLLVIYFAGFATAVYIFTPVSTDCRNGPAMASVGSFQSSEFAQGLSTQMHKCVETGKVIFWRAEQLIKEKYNERTQNDTG